MISFCSLLIGIDLKPMPHIENLVHLFPVSSRLFLNHPEKEEAQETDYL